MSASEMRCPRRAEIGAPPPPGWPTTDTWRHDQTCSYCGSLHPDEFIRRLAAGETIGTTTKTYKAYLDNPRAKFYYQHLSEDQRTEFIRLLNDGVTRPDFEWNPMPFFMRRGPAESTS